MLLSILVYGLTAAVLCYLGWHVSHREHQARLLHGEEYQLPFYSWEILLSILVIAVVAGARWHTGFDHEMYLNEYTRMLEDGALSRARFEFGFKVVTKAFASIKAHYFFYFTFWALLQAGFLYFALRKRKFLLPLIGLNIMLGIYFLNWCNSMRQAVIDCLFVSLVPLIANKSWRNFAIYSIIILLSMLLHRSAIILLPLYLLSFYNGSFGIKSWHKWSCLSIFAICVALGIYPIWFKSLVIINPILKFLGYGIYTQQSLLGDLFNGEFRSVHFGPLRLSLLIADLAIIWYYPKVRQYFRSDSLLPFYFVLSFIGMCSENLLMNTSHYILRPTEYFTIFVMIMSSYTLVYLWRSGKRLISVLLGVIINVYIIIAVISAVVTPSITKEPFLYHFFFLQ